MKIREMDIYFSVPVDRKVLQTCRRGRGFMSAKQLDAEIKNRGYDLCYTTVEACPKPISGGKAATIAEVLGMAPDAVFPQFSAAKAAAEYSPDVVPTDRVKFDLYFTVPVDLAVLKDCRERLGFKSIRQLHLAMKRQNVPVAYDAVETRGVKPISGELAATVAAAMGLAPDVVFPQFSAAKAAAEHDISNKYYRPFTTIEGRNTAIVESMDAARKTALKYGSEIKCEGIPIGREEVTSIAYETLVCVADVAMKKGIKKGTCFAAYACIAVKNAVLQKHNESKRRNLDIFSLEMYTPFYDLPSPCVVDDYVILQDEVCRAVRGLTDKQRLNRHILELIHEWRLEVAYA